MSDKCLRPACIRAAENCGLCKPCHRVALWRQLYALPKPVKPRPESHVDDGPTARMTAEELDAFVEENRATMPGGLNLDGPKSKVGKAGLYKRLS